MEDIEWNVNNEVQLLDAMVGYKPVGISKYFQMALICEKLSDSLRKDVNPEKIWSHLKTMYNLDILDDNESIPFPNSEREFSLPAEFHELLMKKDDEKKNESSTIKSLGKESKTPLKKDPRRDSKDIKTPINIKKDVKATAKSTGKGRTPREDKTKAKNEETPKPAKRTRGSLKANDDSGSSGKSSPLTITPSSGKRRRIV
ncbi:hypothetical protein ABEB36_006823 [Hypothenemus hampei]|uniref:MRG-binding protein n=1 Tax=Hypothenemus hampei TaxID=57062 RepID=A0ABD1EVT6_HYPHA